MKNPSVTGDLEQFRSSNDAYLKFIKELTTVFTEPGETYGNTKVTKRKDGIIMVRIKDGNTMVDFIYRNRDMYIVGIVTGSVFYMDEEEYNDKNKRVPATWTDVIGNISVVSIPKLSYENILPAGVDTRLDINILGSSLKKLTQMFDRNLRFDIIRRHVAPFVVAFSEAIRFPVVARLVQHAIREKNNNPGSIFLSTNIVRMLSLGRPHERDEDKHVFTIYSLLMNWSDLSDGVGLIYNGKNARPIKDKHQPYCLYLDKEQLSALLGVANSQRFSKK